MVFRSEGDIVHASNAAQDLTNLVIAYLTLYKKHAQGMGGVTVPDAPYTVVFLPMREEGKLRVKLVFQEYWSYQEAVYYDVDDDRFSESFGASNVSHHVTVDTERTVDKGLLIPFASLLLPRDDMEAAIKRFAESERNRLQELERESKIAAHQEAIRKLQEQKS